MVLGLAGTTYGLVQAEMQRRKAEAALDAEVLAREQADAARVDAVNVASMMVQNLSLAYRMAGRADQVEFLFEAQVQVMEGAKGGHHPRTIVAILQLALILLDEDRWQEADRYFRDALQRYQALDPSLGAGWDFPQLFSRWISALEERSNFLDAEAILLLLLDYYQSHTSSAHAPMYRRMIGLYDSWHAAEPDKGYDTKAAEWRAKLPTEQDAVASDPPEGRRRVLGAEGKQEE